MSDVVLSDPVTGATIEAFGGGTEGWVLQDLGNWRSLTADRQEILQRPTRHGNFQTRTAHRSGLSFALKLMWKGDSEMAAAERTAELVSIGAENPIDVIVTEALGRTVRRCRVIDIPVTDPHDDYAPEFEIELLADDPRRYAVDDQWVTGQLPSPPSGGLTWPLSWPLTWPGTGGNDGRITLVNRGKRESAPVYRLFGGFSGATLINVATQQRVGIGLIVPFGQFVDIDFKTRRAILGGDTDVSRYITWREWWTVPKNSEVTVQVEYESPGAGAYWAGLVRSAW